jgi:histidinol-phosphate aminotransferase
MDVSRRHLLGVASLAAAPALARAPQPASTAASTAALFAPPPGTAFLARNENPYGPSPAARAAIAEAMGHGCYYSGGAENRLAALLAERNAVPENHVFMGAGSGEVLNCAVAALGQEGAIVAADLTFDPPLRYAEGKGARIVRVPLKPDMGVDLPAMLTAARAPGVSAVHLVNPNNPTGLLLPAADVRAFAAALPPRVTLILDEAYFDLTDDPGANTLADRVSRGDNLIITRTFSKLYGLAGLRVGYALARPDLVAKLAPWGMSNGGNTAGVAAAIASLADPAFETWSRARIVEARALLAEAAARAGLEALPSATNFLYVKVPDANRLKAALEADGVIIRPAYGRWTQWSRVSCGRIEDVRRYAAALPKALETASRA